MKLPSRKRTPGFTLLEMTLAVAMGLGIASALLSMLQQQISFTRVVAQFSFLRQDAPQINTLLSTLVKSADSYRIYTDVSNAKAASNPVRTNGRALRLRLRNPDGTAAHAIISFETTNSGKRLNFYFRNYNQAGWPSDPSWTITSAPDLVDFSNDTGILLVTMTGPNGEEITYAGNPE
jgi:type II secretory pathway pseudopilin PulG